MKKDKFSHFLYFTFILVVISFVTKNIAFLLIKNGIATNNNVFSLTFVRNTGAAFSILQEHSDLLIGFSLLVLSVIIFYTFKHIKSISTLKLNALIFVSAGVICNTIERIIDGYVSDYLNFILINFPVFNVSDLYITVGTILLTIVILFFDK